MSCFNNVSMLQCNAHMLINNVLHDRLFETNFSAANANWLESVVGNLLVGGETGSMFYFGTKPNSAEANVEKRAIGTDIWGAFPDEWNRARTGVRLVRELAATCDLRGSNRSLYHWTFSYGRTP